MTKQPQQACCVDDSCIKLESLSRVSVVNFVDNSQVKQGGCPLGLRAHEHSIAHCGQSVDRVWQVVRNSQNELSEAGFGMLWCSLSPDTLLLHCLAAACTGCCHTSAGKMISARSIMKRRQGTCVLSSHKMRLAPQGEGLPLLS